MSKVNFGKVPKAKKLAGHNFATFCTQNGQCDMLPYSSLQKKTSLDGMCCNMHEVLAGSNKDFVVAIAGPV